VSPRFTRRTDETRADRELGGTTNDPAADVERRVFGTIMTLGTPQDVTLQELCIDTIIPAVEASERTWPRVARSGQK
jgi:hypothetical protein